MLEIDRPFNLLAHRGASGYAPENTFASFDLACAMHADALETDLRLTRDGVIVLTHDPTLERMTGDKRAVNEVHWTELQHLPITGGNGADPTQRVPRVEAFLERYHRRLPLCLEVKAAEVVEPLCAMLQGQGRLDDAMDWLSFTSFEPSIAGRLRDLLPMVRVGLLARDFTSETIAVVEREGFAEICPPARAIHVDAVAAAHARGLGVRAWGIHERDDLRRVYGSGADGCTCNWPDWITRKVGRAAPKAKRTKTSLPGHR